MDGKAYKVIEVQSCSDCPHVNFYVSGRGSHVPRVIVCLLQYDNDLECVVWDQVFEDSKIAHFCPLKDGK